MEPYFDNTYPGLTLGKELELMNDGNYMVLTPDKNEHNANRLIMSLYHNDRQIDTVEDGFSFYDMMTCLYQSVAYRNSFIKTDEWYNDAILFAGDVIFWIKERMAIKVDIDEMLSMARWAEAIVEALDAIIEMILNRDLLEDDRLYLFKYEK